MLKGLNINRIAIFRALQLGDMLCAIPAIRAIRYAYPHANITLIGLPWAHMMKERFPHYFDAFVVFPGYPGLPEQHFDQSQYNDFLKEIRLLKFDLIFQLQGNGTVVNQMIRSFEARHLAGYIPTRQTVMPNEYFMIYPNERHEVLRHLKLLSFLDIPLAGSALEFPIYESDRSAFLALQLSLTPNKYVCIHPGSRGKWRQWPPLYFAKLGDYCHKLGYTVVITGTEDELPVVNQVVKEMKSTPIIAAGKTTLATAAVLLEQSYALISNCTGVSHLASALNKQSVIISMDGEPERWAPLNKQLHVTIDWNKNNDFKLVFKEVAALFFRL